MAENMALVLHTPSANANVWWKVILSQDFQFSLNPEIIEIEHFIKTGILPLINFKMRPLTSTNAVGNTEGLGILERLSRMEAEIGHLQVNSKTQQNQLWRQQNEISRLQDGMGLIRVAELLRYLPKPQRDGMQHNERNDFVHGGDLIFDLEYITSWPEGRVDVIHGIPVERSHLLNAFNTRYGLPVSHFSGQDHLSPQAIETINKKSNLMHLRYWKRPHLLGSRDTILSYSDFIINRWLNGPYSEVEMEPWFNHLIWLYQNFLRNGV
ncbi:hypothetical protein BGW36DRAFT_433870 [Talaromyces proteolyticus]|uniref:Uncharacterized protein n=1 Tax=Talaromyces proteolyticus TaxID=1131652 RepID=A0AAD4KDF9_9EURO|nr:uncharacterized protein BGW36DRAFT_433870 [Talaromyces proteolyticus]KAH8689107.1 hypothetical protein BGW36DRAFT_433870 [Talaromyces proteolyticus]